MKLTNLACYLIVHFLTYLGILQQFEDNFL
jgi:hypothetical protein